MKKIPKFFFLLLFLVIFSFEGGSGNTTATGTISLLFDNYQDFEIVRIYIDGDHEKVLAYKSIDISISSNIVVPITIKNIIFNLSAGESYSGMAQLFSNDSSEYIEIKTNKSFLLNLKDDSDLFIPSHSTGSIKIILNSEYINMKDTNLEKNIIFPENGTSVDFFFKYPSEYFVSNPNPYYTTTNALNYEIFIGILLPGIILLLFRKKFK